MKRSYADITTTLLPVMGPGDPRIFKSILDGSYKLRLMKVTDISKPTAKPIDEIDEPEEEEIARENRLNQTNARMLQLQLKDTNNTGINAIEMERIDKLTPIKANWTIVIEGPIEIRCGNMLLEKRHVSIVEPPTAGEEEEAQSVSRPDNTRPPPQVDLDEIEIYEPIPPKQEVISLVRTPVASQHQQVQPQELQPELATPTNAQPPLPAVHILEDWDDWSDEEGDQNGQVKREVVASRTENQVRVEDIDDDDCIIID